MTNDNFIDTELLAIQVADSTNNYFLNAIRDIDKEFGNGYAKAHPDLVGTWMQTIAFDFNAAWAIREFSKAMEELRD